MQFFLLSPLMPFHLIIILRILKNQQTRSQFVGYRGIRLFRFLNRNIGQKSFCLSKAIYLFMWVVRKNPVSSPRLITNYKKIYISALSSQQISEKTLRLNKSTMKKFLKNLSFRVDIKPYVLPLIYTINTDNMSFVRS